MEQATWKDLWEFINQKIKEEGESFLDNKIYIECQDPANLNQSFQTITDSEGWVYSEPAWVKTSDGKRHVNYTRWVDKKIVSLNINY